MDLGDTNVQIRVNGTTFGGIYEVVGSTVELTSADFGERSTDLGDGSALEIAQQMLRAMVDEAVGRGTLFVQDKGKAEPSIKDEKG